MSLRATDALLGPLLERSAVGIGILDAAGRYVYVNEPLAALNGRPVADHIGNTLAEVIPHIADLVSEFHAEVLSSGEPLLDVQVKGSTPGTPNRIWQVSYLPVEIGGETAVGAVLTDVTEREHAVTEARLRVSQHAAVADLGQRALSAEPIEDLMGAAAESLLRELAADFSAVLEFSPGRDHLDLRAAGGLPDGSVGTLTAPVGRGSQAGYTLLEGGPVVSHDLASESRFNVSPAVAAFGVASAVSTPIPGVDGPFGVLEAFSLEAGRFDLDDASFVRGVANVLGGAVIRGEHAQALEELSGQRGRLVAQALDAGEREQRQVADVLHDDVLQHLLFARQELADASDNADALARARVSVDEATALLRRVVAGLHPITLAHAGLAAAIDSLVGDIGARTGLRTEVSVHPDAEGSHDRLVVSLIRELLTNVAKHAGATRARVAVRAHDDRLGLTVADNGSGLPANAFTTALGEGNIGLATVRERVEALGGSTRVATGLDGRGAAIDIQLPI